MNSTIAVGIAGILISGLIGYIKLQRGKTADNKSEGENRGVMLSDIGYIKSGVDDLKTSQKETAASISGLSERVTRVEESTKQAHHRIDELKKVDDSQ